MMGEVSVAIAPKEGYCPLSDVPFESEQPKPQRSKVTQVAIRAVGGVLGLLDEFANPILVNGELHQAEPLGRVIVHNPSESDPTLALAFGAGAATGIFVRVIQNFISETPGSYISARIRGCIGIGLFAGDQIVNRSWMMAAFGGFVTGNHLTNALWRNCLNR